MPESDSIFSNPLLSTGAYLGAMGAQRLLLKPPAPSLGMLHSNLGLATGRELRQVKRWNAAVSKYGSVRGAYRGIGMGDLTGLSGNRKVGGHKGRGFAIGRGFRKDAYMHTAMRRKLGSGLANRITAHRALGGFIGLANWAFALQMGGAAADILSQNIMNTRPNQPFNPRRELETGNMVVDTRSAFTQRQRAIQAIHNTQLSTRAALGNEAAYMMAMET